MGEEETEEMAREHKVFISWYCRKQPMGWGIIVALHGGCLLASISKIITVVLACGSSKKKRHGGNNYNAALYSGATVDYGDGGDRGGGHHYHDGGDGGCGGDGGGGGGCGANN